MATAEINSLLEKLAEVASRDHHSCVQTIDGLRALQLKLERPDNFMQRMNFTYVEITVTRLAEDLQIYRRLAEHATPVTAAQLSTESGAAPLLMRRILRFLASVGHIEETGQDTFIANDLTRAQARHHGIVYNLSNNFKPALDALPEFLAENGYQDFTDLCNTPVQKVFRTDLPFFEWIHSDPKRTETFNRLHKANEAAILFQWFNVFPMEQELASFAGPHVFVDVGGGLGHRSVKLLAAFPHLKDRMVLQDLPQTLAAFPHLLQGIRAMSHDFFQEQPVKGAKFYYMHHILHNWPDDKAIEILRRLREACEQGSQILIDEVVLPNVGAHWIASSLDILMMTLFGAQERTINEWQSLVEAAGLRIQNAYTYNSRRRDTILQVVAV